MPARKLKGRLAPKRPSCVRRYLPISHHDRHLVGNVDQDLHRTRGLAKWYRLEPNGAPQRQKLLVVRKGASDLCMARLGKTVLSHANADGGSAQT